jgi:hypothetical protein
LSTLTKVLIILLTVFSIFLCGIVVNYVANADHYRTESDQVRSSLRSAEATKVAAEEDLAEQLAATEQLKADYDGQIADLRATVASLQTQINELRADNARLAQQATGFAATVETANKNLEHQQALAATAEEKVTTLEAEKAQYEKELEQTDRALLDQLTLVAQLRDTNRRLIEEKQELETELSQMLGRYGKAVTPPTPVTPVDAIAKPALLETKDVALNAQITGVNLDSSLAEISIGAAAGVRPNMTFHVTRGEQFVCDIRILEVQPDRAVGELTLLDATNRGTPRAGDSAATNL